MRTKGRIFVVRANGAVVSKDAASYFWSGGFESMVLMPGDTIVVPEQTNKGSLPARGQGLVADPGQLWIGRGGHQCLKVLLLGRN